jgi:hypothetical protein
MPDGECGHPITDDSCEGSVTYKSCISFLLGSDARANAIADAAWRSQAQTPAVADMHLLRRVFRASIGSLPILYWVSQGKSAPSRSARVHMRTTDIAAGQATAESKRIRLDM